MAVWVHAWMAVTWTQVPAEVCSQVPGGQVDGIDPLAEFGKPEGVTVGGENDVTGHRRRPRVFRWWCQR